MCSGLEDVRGRLEQVKESLQAKLQVLMRKQDATIAAQKQMHNRLNDVGDDVDTIRSHVGQASWEFAAQTSIV